MSTRSRTPSIAELRAVTQPPEIFARNSGEHWAGRLYIRRLSPYLTRLLLRTPITPNGVTWLMILAGIAAAAVLTLPGVWPAVAAVVLIQLQILLDCSDGELARWTERRSPVGVYLDRLGHWLTEAALPIGLGIRADGGWEHLGGWTSIGLLLAVISLVVKGEGALVHIARLESGLAKVADTAATAAPARAGLARVRSLLSFAPFFRVFVAMEFTLLALAAAIGDEIAGDLDVTRGVLVALIPITAIVAAGRLVAILTSARLRA
ncbi:MAG TPA: CDP-alcohol phosphatidyltransferase family protein [Capillimicrobium sp.]|nr:CDP-alcohol phosphatidyltransferase family protein [Capillimicrobium sp.]